jgi:uncharacterized membrane protein
MPTKEIIEGIGLAIDIGGVVAIVISVVLAGGRFGLETLRGAMSAEERYRTLRRRIGRGILLGLELLVAGDIIRTVAIEPTFATVGVLGLIVLVRTFLSFALEVELTGRWPWAAGDAPGVTTSRSARE